MVSILGLNGPSPFVKQHNSSVAHSRAYNCPGLSGTVPAVARGSRGAGAPCWELPLCQTAPAAPLQGTLLLTPGMARGASHRGTQGHKGGGEDRREHTERGKKKTTGSGRGERNNNQLMILTKRTNATARRFKTVPQQQLSCHFAILKL